MGRTGPFIEISPAQLSVLDASGPGPRCLTQRVDPSLIERVWEDQPQDAAGVLRAVQADLQIEPSRPIVFFQSPTGVSGLFSCPVRVRDFTSAARMSLSEMASFDIESNAWTVQAIERDRAGESRRRHIIVSADTDDTLRQLRALCNTAGLSGATLVPLEAALLDRAVQIAIAHSDRAEPLISVFFGQSRSLIIAAHRQQLLLVRQVDFGTGRLVEALATAIEPAAGDGASDLADRLLFGCGLPRPGDRFEVDGMAFSASDILPAIQPTLQRLVVEVRQSIRFGLSDTAASPSILISGSGASIPRLDEAFGSELGCPCVADTTRTPDANFDLAHAADAWTHGLRVSLRERELGAMMTRNSLRNALYAGSAAAVLIGATTTALLSSQSSPVPAPAVGVESPARGPDDLDPELASRRAAAVRATVLAVAHHTGSQPDMGAVLREMCILSADSAILTDIEISGEGGSAACTLRGYIQGDSPTTAEQLRDLIDRFRASPLVASVRLESTQNSVLDDQTALYFSAVLEFTSTPTPVLQDRASIADASGGRAE